MREAAKEVIEQTAFATPPAVVTATSFAGISFDNWVYLGTIVYIGLQIGFLLYKWRYTHIDRKGRK